MGSTPLYIWLSLRGDEPQGEIPRAVYTEHILYAQCKLHECARNKLRNLRIWFSIFAVCWAFTGILRAEPSGKLSVTFLYCGQGDCAVIETPSGKTYLIDAGPSDKNYGGVFDAGESVIIPFLKSAKAVKLDALLITHTHLDHYGGAQFILNNFNTDEWIDSGIPVSAPDYLEILKTLDAKHIRYSTVKAGDRLDWDKSLTVEVLAPWPQNRPDARKINDTSIVIKLTYGSVSFLFAGDAEKQEQADLVKKYGRKLKSQILKFPHHGSRTAKHQGFLAAVDPETVVISCGRKNKFFHPHTSTLKMLKRSGAKIYRTDTDGSVQVTTDGKTYSIDQVK